MANHGGPTSVPRVHRPRAPIMSVPAPITAPLPPLRPPPRVSLTAPRPENERTTNEYVETPFRQHLPPPPSPSPPTRTLQRPSRLLLPPPPPPTVSLPITKQPGFASSPASVSGTPATSPAPFALPSGGVNKDSPLAECVSRPSIMCPECSRCRCESCQQPRPLPQKWICNNACLLSADTIIDYTSCLCCVKGLYYHCSEIEGGDSCADDPCGCGPDRRRARWGCLTVLSCVLPCLWLYFPLRGCKHVVEACYARHSRAGCRCRPPVPTPEKRLLDSSPDL